MMTPEIVRNKRIFGGKPIIKGTRITVAAVLAQLKNGDRTGKNINTKHVLEFYPQLKGNQIYAVLEYAENLADTDGKITKKR